MSNCDLAYSLDMCPFLGADRATELKVLKSGARTQRIQFEGINAVFFEIIKEQNEYIIEIEDFQNELRFLEEDSKNRMESLENRYWTLKGKALDGTISEDEQKELENIESQINSLASETATNSAELTAQIAESKKSYSASAKPLNFANKLLESTATTIEGLKNWNSNNSVENGGGTICEQYIKTNEIVINDLSVKSSDLSEKVNVYYSQLNFIKC